MANHDKKIANVYRKTKSVSAVAKAVGYTLTGARRAIVRLGLKRK